MEREGEGRERGERGEGRGGGKVGGGGEGRRGGGTGSAVWYSQCMDVRYTHQSFHSSTHIARSLVPCLGAPSVLTSVVETQPLLVVRHAMGRSTSTQREVFFSTDLAFSGFLESSPKPLAVALKSWWTRGSTTVLHGL